MKRNVKRFVRSVRRNILEIADPVRQAETARGWKPETEVLIRSAETDKSDLQKQKTEQAPIAAQPEAHGAMSDRWVAGGAGFCDATAWYITTRATMPAVPEVWAVVGSVGIVLFLATVIHHLAQRLPVLFDHERPARTIRNNRRVAWIAGAVAFLAFVGFVGARGLPAAGAKIIIKFGWVLFLLLNLGAPVCCGVFSALATYCLAPAKTERRLRRVTEDLFLLRELRRWLEEKSGGPDTPNPQRASVGVPVAAILNMVLVTALMLGTMGAVVASDCSAQVDGTPSVDPAHRQRVREFIPATLPELVESFGCDRLVVGHFVDGPWAERRWFTTPKLLPPIGDCATVEPPPLEGFQSIWDWFESVRQERRDEYRERCRQEEATRAAMWEQAWAKLASDVAAALEVPVPRADTTTKIRPLLEAEIRQRRLVVLATDGIETPRSSQTFEPIAVPDGTTVVMLLAPPDPANPQWGTATESLATAKRWQQAVPGLVVVLTSDLHPGLWREIAAKEADHAPNQ